MNTPPNNNHTKRLRLKYCEIERQSFEMLAVRLYKYYSFVNEFRASTGPKLGSYNHHINILWLHLHFRVNKMKFLLENKIHTRKWTVIWVFRVYSHIWASRQLYQQSVSLSDLPSVLASGISSQCAVVCVVLLLPLFRFDYYYLSNHNHFGWMYTNCHNSPLFLMYIAFAHETEFDEIRIHAILAKQFRLPSRKNVTVLTWQTKLFNGILAILICFYFSLSLFLFVIFNGKINDHFRMLYTKL